MQQSVPNINVHTPLTPELQVVEHGRKAGESDIEREITSQQNPRLILHDSQGFSHADAGNFEIVQTFIEKRSKMTDLKDRLHAIWFDVSSHMYSYIDGT
jgi:hypothetical protein